MLRAVNASVTVKCDWVCIRKWLETDPTFGAWGSEEQTVTLWTPDEITTSLWLDASDGDTLTLDVSNNVEQWDDKSGNNKHATQGTSANRPAYSTTAWDGVLPALTFDGTNDQLITTLSLPASHSVFFVAERGVQGNNTSSILRPVLEATDGSDSGLRSYGTQRGTLENLEAAIQATRIATDLGNWEETEKLVVANVYDQSDLIGYRNGVQWGSIESADATERTVHIGGSPRTDAAGTVRRFAGKIAEIIVVGNAVTASIRQKIEGYLAWRWGLVGDLPAAHPYKVVPPTIYEKGSYLITGKDLPSLAIIATVSPGAYTLTGKNANFWKVYNLLANKGDYNLTGKDVALFKRFVFLASAGEYILTGKDASFEYNIPIMLRGHSTFHQTVSLNSLITQSIEESSQLHQSIELTSTINKR
jgi:hypothetical protein